MAKRHQTRARELAGRAKKGGGKSVKSADKSRQTGFGQLNAAERAIAQTGSTTQDKPKPKRSSHSRIRARRSR